MRHLIIPLLTFIVFYVLFWNWKRWADTSHVQRIGLVFLCALVAAVTSSGAVWLLITFFN